MHVVQTAPNGVVGRDTVFKFYQVGDVVTASYSGGRVRVGYLVGILKGDRLSFRYCQVSDEDHVDGGSSNARIESVDGGRLRLIESFKWESRDGSGENIFEEVGGEVPNPIDGSDAVGSDQFNTRRATDTAAMKPFQKVALVAGGYLVCLLIASAAVALRIAVTDGPASQAAGGMYGFGDVTLFVAAFGVSALVPTGVALFFLRAHRTFWKVLSTLVVATAATGVAAAILFAVGRSAPASRLAMWAGLSVLRILVSPLLALAFLVCAVFSPHRPSRIAFLAAAAIEGAVCLYGGTMWLFHRP